MKRLLKKLEVKQPQLLLSYEKERDKLLADPISGKKLIGDLSDYYSWAWTFKGVALRICYKIADSEETVIIVYFGTRDNFYDQVKNYLN